MASVATLAVSVTARVNKFVKGFKEARKSLAAFGSRIAAVAKRMAAFGAVVGAAAITALVALTKHALSTVDAISKLSDRLGISTENLIALRHAAEITGVGADQMTTALEQMTRRLGEATQGTGLTYDMLKALGLQAEELAKMPAIDAFNRLRKAIAAVPNVAQRAQAAYTLFGRQGVKMLNLLNLTDEQFAALTKEVEDMGLTFSRVSGAQVEAANDAMTRLKETLALLGQAIAVKIAPYLKVVADRLRGWIKNAGDVRSYVTAAFEAIAKGIGIILDYLELGKAAWYGWASVGGEVLGFVSRQITSLILLIQKLSQALGSDIADGIAQDMRAIQQALEETTDEAEQKFKDAIAAFSEQKNYRAALKAFDEIRKGAEAAAKEVADAAVEMNKAKGLSDFTRRARRARERPGTIATRTDTFLAAALSPYIRALTGTQIGSQEVHVQYMKELLDETKKQTFAIDNLDVGAVLE